MVQSSKVDVGTFLCIGALIFYCLLRLSLNLSVECANENQGLFFIWGQSFLRWHELVYGRGILFVLLYATVLKLFGFNTYSIIAIHIIETLISILVGLLIYFIVRLVLKNSLFAGLSTILWVIMISTPIGASSLVVELRSHYNLNEENLCILFSLGSILCLLLGNFIGIDYKPGITTKEKVFSFLAGLLAICSLMSKANGAIILIATVLWFLSICIFKKEDFKFFNKKFAYYFSGMMLSLFFFNIILYVLHRDLFLSWRNYFLIGSYTNSYLISVKSLLYSIFQFMTRHSNSLSNFILFLFALLSFCYGLIRFFIINSKDYLSKFWLLISIWGLGNVCAIIAPGEYQPYYYHLIWPSIAIVFALGVNDLFFFLKKSNKKLFLVFVLLFAAGFFIHRAVLTIPAHCYLIKELNELSNVFNQPQSFQDPVLPYNPGLTKREGLLKAADVINVLLPDKDDTFFIFNFGAKRITGFTPLSYIYAKRYPPTTIDSAPLKVNNIINTKLTVLKRDLLNSPPDLIIISKDIYLEPSQEKYLAPFVNWFSQFLANNKYRIVKALNFTHIQDGKTEIFNVYSKTKV